MDKHIDGNKILDNIGDKYVTEDDSILDFTSPKQFAKTELTEPCNLNEHQNKRMVTKSKNFHKSHKEVKHKQHMGKKRNLQESQPSIESSFFKSKTNYDDKDSNTNIKVALVCPLCFKTFKDLNSRVLHMKICAYKNNVSTKKLLDVIELQKRQENERKSLGLLAAPIIQDKKKPMQSHKMSSFEETDLQLAIALSKSLHEAKELHKSDEIEGLPKILNEFRTEVNESVYESQLEKFGFANSKAPSLLRNKRKKRSEMTLLQTRSQKERNHILTQRISAILMGNEPITQNQEKETKHNHIIEKKTDLRSYLLKEFCNKEKKLWNGARLTPNQKCFYVPNLSEFITPKEKRPVSEKEEIVSDFTTTCNMYNMELNQYKTKAFSNEKIHKMSSKELCFTNEKCESYQNKMFINSAVANWSAAVNDNSTSDIIIFVNNNKHIWAHKLVFYVQCSNILLDVRPNDTLLSTTIKEKICWLDISYNIALAFLEFVYCGIINRYLSVLENLASFSYLRNLARKYEVKELFIFLQKKEIEIKQTKSQVHNKYEKESISKEIDILELNNDNIENLIFDSRDPKSHENTELNRQHLEKCIIDKSEFNEIEFKKNVYIEKLLKKENNCSNEINVLQNSNLSSDLFDDINDTIKSEGIKNITKHDDIIDVEKIGTNGNVSTLNVVDQTIFDTANFSKFNNTITHKITDGHVRLLSNVSHFTTPEREEHHDTVKLKSNLSIFIEQFQRKNATSESDSDYETSIIPTCPKLYRNPFSTRQRDSSKYETNNATKETFKKEKDILSVFDYVTNLKPMSNVIQLSKPDVEECSRKYEDNLTNNGSDTDEELQNEAVYSVSENSLKESMESPQNIQNENDDDVFLNSDIDEDESMYSKYKRGHINNSIVNYRNFVQKHVLRNNTEKNTTYNKYRKENNVGNNILLLSDTDRKFEAKTSSVNKHGFQTKRSISNFNNLSNLRHSKSENSIDLQTNRRSSLALANLNMNKYDSVKSPVLMSSTSELDYDTLNMYRYKEDKINKNASYSEKSQDNTHVLENDIYLANVYIDNTDDDSNRSMFSEKVNLLNEEIVSVGTTIENNQLITINNPLTKKFKDTEKLLIMQENCRKFQRKSMSEASLHINTKSDKSNIFKVYNNSQCSFSYEKCFKVIASPEIVRDSITPPPNYNGMKTPELNAELNKYGLKIQKRKRAVKLLTYIYNELHPTISTTSNNIESGLEIISSEDDEPPMKKVNCRENDVDCIHHYESQLTFSQKNIGIQSPRNIINEENQFDELEFTSTINDASNIKNMFLKLLILKKDLHNKILAYEPLCINSLHFMLRTEGFKCKMNALMDFLDEQCITFYVQETKQKN